MTERSKPKCQKCGCEFVGKILRGGIGRDELICLSNTCDWKIVSKRAADAEIPEANQMLLDLKIKGVLNEQPKKEAVQ